MHYHTGIHLLTTHARYKFDQTDREVFESTLDATLSSAYFSGFTSTNDLYKYVDVIVAAVSTGVDKAIPKSKSKRSESNPISDETVALSKEKRRLNPIHTGRGRDVFHLQSSKLLRTPK